MKGFNNVLEPSFSEVFKNNHDLKGNWHREWFGNDRPIVVELGCGKGEYTVGLAEKFPEKNFIGIDIKGARLWKGARESYHRNIANAAFLRTRIEFIESFFAPGEIDEIWITFPDPQPKRKREKKRLPGPVFLNIYRRILKGNGIIHLKTDNRELFDYALSVVNANSLDIISSSTDLYSQLPGDPLLSIRTYYEEKFLEQGIPITYLAFRLPDDKEIINP